jgi:meso-butanediol dehydrogenase/(S,S)-butanediol dehydrogenase/diacetyl reductase
MRLAHLSALITGGGAGIGAATALKFCQEGAAVTLVDADPEALTRTALSIEQAVPGAKVAQFAADVSDEEAALRAVQIAVAQHGGLNILVNNAAMRNFSALADATTAEWQAMIQSGCIVNVSSCYAVTGRKGMGLYDATKAAQLAMTRTLAHEEAPHGVRVNAVCPGSTLTDFHTTRAVKAGKSVDVLKKERQVTSLMGRWADPQEIAAPILWLASSEASFITGTTLMVDGGLHIM